MKIPDVLVAVLSVALTGASAARSSLTTGVFDTNFGEFTLTARDGRYDDSDGRVYDLRVRGNVVEGSWVQTMSSRKCSDGRYRGRFRLEFTPGGFTGTWGWCDQPLTAGEWHGTRRQ